MLFRGSFVHTPHLGTLEILEDHLIGGISNLYWRFRVLIKHAVLVSFITLANLTRINT